MVQSAISRADCQLVAASVTEVGDDLLKLFGAVSDGRSGQGRDHPVAAVLALAARRGWSRRSTRLMPGRRHHRPGEGSLIT